ncbi:MAG: hypothetical protein ACI91B_001025 [Planctomycetota bacterium]|jgi:hypothetical protein
MPQWNEATDLAAQFTPSHARELVSYCPGTERTWSPASGMLGINQYVPPIAGLVGFSFHAQWLVLLSGGELVTSDGLRITLGS